MWITIWTILISDSYLIKKILRFAKKKAIQPYLGDLTPLHPVTRAFQVNWQKSVNSLLKSAKMISVHYSDMPLSGLDKDGIHPNPKGYDFITERVQKHFENTFGNSSKHNGILKSLKVILVISIFFLGIAMSIFLFKFFFAILS